MCKNRIANLIFIFLSVLFMAILGVSSAKIAHAEETIDYGTIRITQTEEGLFYGNNDENKKRAADLQSIIDEINDNLKEDGKNPLIVFENVTTDNQITLDYSRIFVFNGSVTYTGANDTSFITVKSGTMRTVGGFFKSSHANIIKLNSGATLETTGTFTVNGEVGLQNVATVLNDGGTVVMTGGAIVSENSDDTTGIAYYQRNNGKIEMRGGDITGEIAAYLQSGTAELSGGTIKTGKINSKWNDAGVALQVCNTAKVELAGTTIGNSEDRIAVSFEAGSSEGEIEFIGGTVKGEIILSKTSVAGYGGYVYVNGRKLRQVTNGRIFLYSEDGELTVNNGKLKFEGDKEGGYYLSSWNNDPSKGQNPDLLSFAEGETITPNLSNLYRITVVMGETTNSFYRVYNETIDLLNEEDDCYMPAPDGYAVEYWSDGCNTGTEFKVTGEMTLTAKLTLVAPVISAPENLSCPYDGTTKTVSAEVNIIDGLSYEYLWEKFDASVNGWIEYSRSESLSVKNHSDSGKYRLTVEVGDGEENKKSISSEITVDIAKINYYGVTHEGLSGTYDKDKTLGDYALSPYFYWEEEGKVPTVSQTKYNAKYCADEDNYYVFSLEISLVLQKAAGVAKTYPTMQGNYVFDENKTLADYTFADEGWRWKDSDTVPEAGQKGYDAYYNPDRENYEDYLVSVKIDIAKANYSGIEDLTLSYNYAENLTAGKVFDNSAVPSGYYMGQANRAETLERIESYEFGGYFNADKNNYNDFSVKIFINVEKGNYSEIYYGNDNTVEGGAYREGKLLKDIVLKDGFYWVDENLPVTTNNNGYEAYYNKDPDRYNNYNLILKVSMTKGEVPMDERVNIDPIKGVYSPEKTLAEYLLPAGFVWLDENYVPIVSDEEYCTAKFLETESYLSYTVDVKIELRKADYDLRKAFFEDKTVVYDGQEHSIEIEGVLPDGVSFNRYEGSGKTVGEYAIYAYLSQEDTQNYNVIDRLSATLIIEKAEYDMSGVIFADAAVVYDGTEHSLSVSGQLPDGVSVNGYSGEGYVNSGSYKITVSFSQEDSYNYKKVNEMAATLTIKKAQCVFFGETEQRAIYDGTSKKPVMSVNNVEQTVFDDAQDGYVDFGRYKVKFYTEESMNYLKGEISVYFDITGYEIECENNESEVGVFNLSSEQVGTLTVETKSSDTSMTVTLLVDGKEQEGLFGIKIEIPESFLGKDVSVDYITNDGKRIACEAKEEDGYLWLSVNKLGKFDIYVEQSEESDGTTSQWWIWLIIGLSCAIVAGGLIVVAIFIVKRKKANARVADASAAVEASAKREYNADKGDNDGE